MEKQNRLKVDNLQYKNTTNDKNFASLASKSAPKVMEQWT